MWPNLQFPADLVTFTEEILNGKHHFCAVSECRVPVFPRIRDEHGDLILTPGNTDRKKLRIWYFSPNETETETR